MQENVKLSVEQVQEKVSSFCGMLSEKPRIDGSSVKINALNLSIESMMKMVDLHRETNGWVHPWVKRSGTGLVMIFEVGGDPSKRNKLWTK